MHINCFKFQLNSALLKFISPKIKKFSFYLKKKIFKEKYIENAKKCLQSCKKKVIKMQTPLLYRNNHGNTNIT